MNVTALEESAVEALIAADLPELREFAIESLAGQVDLENDELNLAAPHLLVAVVGGNHVVRGGDAIDFAFCAVVPGTDQKVRRQSAMDALFAIRAWMEEAHTNFVPKTTRPERLHPVFVGALFAQLIG